MGACVGRIYCGFTKCEVTYFATVTPNTSVVSKRESSTVREEAVDLEENKQYLLLFMNPSTTGLFPTRFFAVGQFIRLASVPPNSQCTDKQYLY